MQAEQGSILIQTHKNAGTRRPEPTSLAAGGAAYATRRRWVASSMTLRCSFRIRRVPRGRKTAYLSLYRADLSTSIAARGAGNHHGNESMVHNRNIEGLRSRLGRDGAGAGRSGHRNGARRENTGSAGRTLRRAS